MQPFTHTDDKYPQELRAIMSPLEQTIRSRETRSLAIVLLGIVIAIGVRIAPLDDAQANRIIVCVGLALAGVVGFYNTRLTENIAALEAFLQRRGKAGDFEHLFKLSTGVIFLFAGMGGYIAFAIARAWIGLPLPVPPQRLVIGQILVVAVPPFLGLMLGKALAAITLLVRSYRSL
jgi:hypothetical protein